MIRLAGLIAVPMGLFFAGRAAFGLYELQNGPPRVSDQYENINTAANRDFPGVEAFDPGVWKIFRSFGAASGDQGPLARFRLAGTFFASVAPGLTASIHGQRAIIDDLVENKQHLVSQGDGLDEFEIALIERDRVVLRSGLDEYELTIGFRSRVAPTPQELGASPAQSVSNEVLEVTSFGKRVGDTRWVLSKEKMREYYEGLMDSPERLAALYMSMKADFKEGVVAGYRVQPAGERDFFREMGLKDGDVIRRVNSMNMVSQARAEYFMSEFAKDRLGAIVLEVSRNGKDERLVYLIR